MKLRQGWQRLPPDRKPQMPTKANETQPKSRKQATGTLGEGRAQDRQRDRARLLSSSPGPGYSLQGLPGGGGVCLDPEGQLLSPAAHVPNTPQAWHLRLCSCLPFAHCARFLILPRERLSSFKIRLQSPPLRWLLLNVSLSPNL